MVSNEIENDRIWLHNINFNQKIGRQASDIFIIDIFPIYQMEKKNVFHNIFIYSRESALFVNYVTLFEEVDIYII